jgi:surfactin synthase thioesterase subunit
MLRLEERSATDSAWLCPLAPQRDPRMRLICFPYAGGGANVFRPWARALAPAAEVWAMSLPGRATRVREAAVARMAPIVSAVTDELGPLTDRPFVLFGHSLGALVAFEVARELRRRGMRAPAHVLVSAARAPQHRLEDPIHELPDDQFIERIRGLKGTPAEVLENRQLVELLLPALRADFAVGETYRYASEPPLSAPVTAFGGSADDHVSSDQLDDWYRHTRNRFAVRTFQGGHFFIHSAQDELLDAVAGEIGLAA